MLKDIILEHISRYPMIQIQDIVKLIYQNEFGGGHFVSDEAKSYERIVNEIADHEVYFEEIGNGQARLYLGNLTKSQAHLVNKMFILSSNNIKGTKENFIEKLEELKTFINQLPFTLDELEDYLTQYQELDYPMVSHSDIYKQHYDPHYRVVDQKYAQYYSLIMKINEIKTPLTIAIDGMCGAGKSTLGNMLHELFESNLFKMDDFFLQPHQRCQERLNEAGGNVDYERFNQSVLKPLLAHKDIEYQIFDCSTMSLKPSYTVAYLPLNIIEGTYSQHPYFNDIYDYKIFIETTDDIQKQRILKRNGEMMYKKFEGIWIPMENKYFNTYNIKQKADYIFET